MNRYDVKLSQNAESYYKRTGANTKERLERCFEDLEEEPKDWSHPRVKKLRGELSGLWRYRVGDLRVVYRVKDQQKVVDVVAIGPRGDIY